MRILDLFAVEDDLWLHVFARARNVEVGELRAEDLTSAERHQFLAVAAIFSRNTCEIFRPQAGT